MTPWQDLTPQAKVDVVRELVEHGRMAYRAAARRLGTTVGSVASVADRSREHGRPIVASSGLINQWGGRVARKKKSERQSPIRLDPTPLSDSTAWLPLPGSTPVPLAEHTTGCRWPCGNDRPFLCCNEAVAEGSVYCPHHDAVAYKGFPGEQRKDTR